jgi:hypothetical protein
VERCQGAASQSRNRATFMTRKSRSGALLVFAAASTSTR